MGLDPSISAFAAASGATDLTALNNLAKYLRSQSLLSSVRCFPFKSAQNAGSGSTVYGWGDLTTNDMTLVNSPTWGTGGIAFASASSQYGSIADFLGTRTLTALLRTNCTAITSGVQALWSRADAGADLRSYQVLQNGNAVGDPILLVRSSDGGLTNAEQYTASPVGFGADSIFVTQWVDGGGRSLWLNKSALSLTLDAGSEQTAVFDSGQDIRLNCQFSNGSPVFMSDQTAAAFCFITGTLTTTQRETITDLINAL